jgi:amidohydrolase
MNTNEFENLKTSLYDSIDQLRPTLEALSKDIHAHPEVNFEEKYASQIIAELMDKHDFVVEKPLGGLETAFRAERILGTGFPKIAFLAEYDALPELGHACGHNLIAAASVGAALGLARVSSINASVQLIGTPAEEGGGGKIYLAEAGVFNGLGAAMMFHPANKSQLWKYALASTVVKIEFFGKASHSASSPEIGLNALDAIIQTFNSINALRQHVKSDVRIHGIIEEGGKVPNIVPDYASALFYIRSLDDDYCREIVQKVKNCALGASLATGTKLTFTVKERYETLKTNLALSHYFQQQAEDLGLVFVDNEPYEDLGSTDLGNVSHITPVIHPYLSIGPDEMMYHSEEFAYAAISEKGFNTMIIAAKALASTALAFVVNEDFRKAVTMEFQYS